MKNIFKYSSIIKGEGSHKSTLKLSPSPPVGEGKGEGA
jgi:hypothetical protein